MTSAVGRAAPRPKGQAPPQMAAAHRWQYFIERAIARHRWAWQGLALKWSKAMRRRLDTRRPTGLTIQGQRWGWREIRASW